MKKYILIVVLCIIACGCGSKDKDTNNNSEKIKNSDIGINDITYKLDVTCGDKSATSSVFFGKDATASYNLFECSGSDLHLTSGEGSYEIDGDKVILTDNYETIWEITVKDDTIEIILNDNVQTLTK